MKFTGHEVKAGIENSRTRSVAIYDFLALLFSFAIVLFATYLVSHGYWGFGWWETVFQIALGIVCVAVCRTLLGTYRQIWRFFSLHAYIRLIEADMLAGFSYVVLDHITRAILRFSGIEMSEPFTFVSQATVICISLVLAITMRMFYQFLYQRASASSRAARVVGRVARLVTGLDIKPRITDAEMQRKIKIAIVGAGRVGSMLAEELLSNENSPYVPVCFVDTDRCKTGRQIAGLNVISEEHVTPAMLAHYGIQEFVIAIPDASVEAKKEIYENYKKTGCKLKVYDYPQAEIADGGKRHLRDFEIEDLLFRETKEFTNEKTREYYRGKTILISGGGGSIGSELCRQIAKTKPKKLIILDVYENGAYDIQQELRIAYGKDLCLQVEIASVCDRDQLDHIFAAHRPDIVLHAAAHKHVPLMEHNCCEAVRNNVFGTLNIVEVSEKYGVSKFTMISTDKAVNPTNVMGATKRMCEMIVQSRTGATNFSATRFGNVLGSNGSVIPLFKRQIANGGPVTLTDKRIIRYFMTIPEASQLVLQSGAMAKNGELYVLNMGKPVKIIELAENMIRFSGFEPYRDIDIVESGLRPGEKLYEELLIRSEELDKTENSMIFVERDKPLSKDAIDQKLAVLRQALATNDDQQIKEALKKVVPTFRDPEQINKTATRAAEMQLAENSAVEC